MNARYKHTNIVARDWKKLARFYEEVFGCVRVPPERHLSGEWIEKGTGVRGARISGVHLRLPGHGRRGPTLEIFQYEEAEDGLPPKADRCGYGHVAFEVEDVAQGLKKVIEHGGAEVGKVTSLEIEGVGTVAFVYAADPEGNIVELQSWI